MKSRVSGCIFIFIFIIMPLVFDRSASAIIVTYPVPPGLKSSPDFTLRANDIPIWVERIGSRLSSFSYDLYSGRDMEDLNVANFSCSGEITIKITSSSNIDSFKIRPINRNIKATVNGRDLIFTIPGPQKLYIEINGLPHLAIFADPIEINPPKEGDRDVIFISPGTYSADSINLRSNQTIYIAGGAILNANIRGNNLHNVKISGHGILQGTPVDKVELLVESVHRYSRDRT